MTKSVFIHDNFLLNNEIARELYHDVARQLPVIDYHNHLPPEDIASNRQFKNLHQIWLAGDHYKWRAMRTCGVNEERITGNESEWGKFYAWAETVPKTVRNPLYHWTHMELAKPFGIRDRLLNGETADEIWEACNEMLADPEFTAVEILKKSGVELVATTDDPTDSLVYHQQYRQSKGRPFQMVPTFRPDKGMSVENHELFAKWIERLEEVTNRSVSTFQDLMDALKMRHDAFHELGCRASDHGISEPFSEPFTVEEVDRIFQKARSGKEITEMEARQYKSAFLFMCGVMNAEKGWVFQLHIGAIRNNNTRMFNILGADSGYDSMGDFRIAQPLARLLNQLDMENQLPRTVLYNINPADNEVMATMAGNFQDGVIPGKIQHGPPWWFLDQKNGIEKQLDSLSDMGILSEFIGMTTDSRSFLSFSRHDYFRRILCNSLGRDVEKGLIPNEREMLDQLVKKICYLNAKSYFRYPETEAGKPAR